MRLTKPKTSLGETLRRHASPAAAALAEELDEDAIRCHACGHECRVQPGATGICKVRYNDNGCLMVPWGYVAGLALDPIEKKPFFHAFPGKEALSFGMLGCNLHCNFCQNWITSQALRDSEALTSIQEVTPGQLVHLAAREGAPVITSTYNEPLITSEWAVEIFQLGREKGIRGGYVSNGHANPRVLEFLRPWVDLYKVDLKCFTESGYRELGGTLKTVTSTLRELVAAKFWVEVVTLLVPGFNDDEGELRELTQFLAELSPDIPWHVTAFHPDYRLTEIPRTQVHQLLRAAETGVEAGLRYVYTGNLPGQVGEWENTRCPACSATLIRRSGFIVRENRLTPDGRCPDCSNPIPGVWK